MQQLCQKPTVELQDRERSKLPLLNAAWIMAGSYSTTLPVEFKFPQISGLIFNNWLDMSSSLQFLLEFLTQRELWFLQKVSVH